jgi:hypothetical protein
VGVFVGGGATEVLVGVRLGVRVLVGEAGGDVGVFVPAPASSSWSGCSSRPGVGVRVRVGVRDAVGVGPVAVRVGVCERVGVREGVTVAMVIESETVQPLEKVSVAVQLPRMPPTGSPSKST